MVALHIQLLLYMAEALLKLNIAFTVRQLGSSCIVDSSHTALSLMIVVVHILGLTVLYIQN